MKTIVNERYVVEFEGRTYDLHNRQERISFGMAKWEKMIHGMAAKHRNSVLGYEDFVQEANLIIINAADRWIADRGAFDTFCYECIKNGLIDASTRTRHAVSVPSGSFKLAGGEGGIRTTRLNEEIPDESGDAYEVIDIVDTIHNFDHFRVGQMYFVEKRTMEEISEMTGISRSKVGRMITQMKNLIQKRLEVC